MTFKTFNTESNSPLKQNMFLGESVSVSRYDQQRHPVFEQLTEKQLSFFWRPEEVDVSRDRVDFAKLSEGEKHIFISNLKYQTLLDSVQGRSPNACFLPIVSLPELETWIETWSFSETVHSRSYTHIIRNVFTNPTEILDSITQDQQIIKRAESVTRYYDELYDLNVDIHHLEGKKASQGEIDALKIKQKKALYRCMLATNVLEAIRFYVSFACSFAFAERKMMEGNAKIIKLIARDEALHLNGTQQILNLWAYGLDDPDMEVIAQEMKDEAIQIFMDAVEQEKEWAEHLFSKGSMIGLNKDILCQYVEYIANQRMTAVGLPMAFSQKSNPLPWINSWLVSDAVQVAPQEAEISSYLTGAIDAAISEDDFAEFGEL